MEEQVFDCVMPYIQDNDNLNSVSLVSKKHFDIDSLTRKHVTVHVHYLKNPQRLSLRFPNLESLTLKSYNYGFYTAYEGRVPVTPWIEHIAVEFKRLKSLSIRNMVVSDSDLQHLAKTRGGDLRSLEIRGCKMFSEDGLVDIARCCIDLRSLRLYWNDVDDNDPYENRYGIWLHELALRNSVMESLSFHTPFDHYLMEDVELLANKCSNSLVFLNVFPQPLQDFQNVLKHAKKLDHFGYGITDEHWDYSGFEIPSNIHALCIRELGKASFPFILPYLNQLRELVLECGDMEHNCQCLLFESCPNLEVLATEDICGEIGCQVIGKFCKKLRKLTHHGLVTHMGLIALAQGCHNLDYLEVNLKDISNEALECVGTHLKNLRDFRNFRNFFGSKASIIDSPLDSGVRAMLMGCSKLKRLHISVCLGGLTDMGLGYIGKYGHNLRTLFLGCTGESDAGLLELSKGCPKLRKLELNDCPFSEEAIANFAFNIHSLRYIRVRSGYHTVLALTRPTVPAEVLEELKPYIILAEKLHRLALQLAADGSGVGLVKMTCTSSRATDALDTRLVSAMVAKGIRINEERVILDRPSEKPLEIIKVQIANVESRFTIAISESGEIVVEGRVKGGVPHLTKVGAFEVDVSLEGNIILCRQFDQPNTIGSVTSILGEENLNISSMSVGSTTPRKQAVMVIGVDGKPSKEALKKIDEIPAVEEFVFLVL